MAPPTTGILDVRRHAGGLEVGGGWGSRSESVRRHAGGLEEVCKLLQANERVRRHAGGLEVPGQTP